MIVHVNLKNLTLKNIKYEGDILKYNGYLIELWNSDILSELAENFDVAQEFFFQDEITIDKDLINEVNVDETETVYELINLLFGNVQKAIAVQKYTKENFQNIKEGTIIYDSPITYTVDGINYDAYYDSEVINEAKEMRSNFLNDNPLYDLIDKHITDYLDYIDIPNLVKTLRKIVSKKTEINWDMPDDDIQFIKEYTNRFDDIVEQIEDNDYFDYDKLIDEEIVNVSDALDELSGLIGDLVYSNKIQVGKWKTETVYLFETY